MERCWLFDIPLDSTSSNVLSDSVKVCLQRDATVSSPVVSSITNASARADSVVT